MLPILKYCKKQVNAIVASVAGTITHVLTEERAAALTFDDGPHPQWTPKLLDILDRHEARATFFCLGRFAEQHPDIVHRTAKAGHAIGNHTYDHPSLPLIRRKERKAQLAACERALAPHSRRLFRPPYGFQSWATRFDLLRLGYEVVGWSVSAEDWLDHDAAFMVDQLRRQIRPGCIILLHDRIVDAHRPEYFNRKPMLEALDEFLSEFAREYEFMTIPELMKRGRAQRQNWFWKPNVLYLNTLVEEKASGRRYEAK
jgi:peptidoglycan/xylan/chitin deacetylase (PgdA/CDA1 family)